MTHQLRPVEVEPRIVGGTEAGLGEYSFFVEWENCGASLIHEDIILTAAHCFLQPSDRVHVGAYRYNSTEGEAEERSIVARRPHPYYNPWNVENDFAVMKLDEPSKKVPIQINSDPDVPADKEQLTVIGFGRLDEDSLTGSSSLQKVDVEALPRDVCKDLYKDWITETVMMCAGVAEGGKDSCQGDSGGPLIDSRGVQIGIVSWGYGCGQPEYPGVYSRISGEVKWIKKQICDLAANPPEDCPEPSPPGSEVSVKISLNLDDYPLEVGFKITDSAWETIVDHPTGTLTEPGMFTETVDLFPGEYRMRLTDAYRDGFCCVYGGGGYEISATVEDDNILLLAEGDGSFGAEEDIYFSVPTSSEALKEDPKRDPLPTGCLDRGESFSVSLVTHDCNWLKQKSVAQRQKLCKFFDVAVTCRKTCNVCEYFEGC